VLGVGAAGAVGDAEPPATAPGTQRGADGREAERDAWAVLASVVGLGPVGFAVLLRRFGSGRRILEVASEPGGPERLAAASAEPTFDGERARRALSLAVTTAIAEAAADGGRVLARIASLGLQVVTVDDAAYPSRLGAIEFPPHLLFVDGDVAALEPEHAVAVVGTRRATFGGRGLAARVAHALSVSGATIVSGLALGIDGAAHAATVDAHGRTVAVIGGGHGQVYPRAHARLARAIVEAGGAVVSELAPDFEPTKGTFPRRNRVISGLADATVVIEAPAKSGALVTASWALEQGRECFLVPGRVDDPASAGCLSFLREFRDGTRIVAGIPQLIEDLGLAVPPDAPRATALAGAALIELGVTTGRVGEGLVSGHATVDELVSVTGFPVATVLASLTLLERRGLAVGVFGRYRPAGDLVLAGPANTRSARSRDGAS
jgi:DNA processing protein